MAYDPSVIQATEIYYLIFGMLTLLGGIVGYAKGKRAPALVIGLIFGITLVSAGVLLLWGQTNTIKIGLIVGLLGTAVLSGLFIPKVMMNRAAPHVIAMAVLSGIGMVLTLIALAGK